MKLKRRDFLKITALMGATGMMPNPIFNSLAFAQSPAPKEEGNWVPTTCKGCTQWCPIEVFVQGGRATLVRGNQHSKVNRGYCCPRGHLNLQMLYDPDRVKVPLKRTNPQKGRGVDPKFVPISWDEAINTIAEKIIELRKNKETHKLLLMRGRYTGMYPILYDALVKIVGSPNNISHSSICAEVEKMGRFYTWGFFGYADFDLDQMKYLILWGCDPVSSNRNVPVTMNRIGRLLEQGTVVSVNPRMDNIAAKAHEWLPVKPGEDAALALAMAHVILVEGLWNKEFVGDFKDGVNRFKPGQIVDEATFNEKLTYGLVKWWNLELKDRTPEWAEPICGIPKEQIRRVAIGFAKAAPNCAVWNGPTMMPKGTYVALCIEALNGLVGAVDSPGGTFRGASAPRGEFPSMDKYLDDIAKEGSKKQKIDQRGYLKFPNLAEGTPGRGVATNNVANAILAKDPYDIKVAIAYYANFNFSCTETKRWDRALAQIPFFVHITTHVTEMSQFADIVLPTTFTQMEEWAFDTNKGDGYAHMSILQPVAKKIFDVRAAETEIPFMIAVKLKEKGFSNLYDYYVNEFKDPESGKAPTTPEEFALFALKKATQKVWDPNLNKDYKGDRPQGWQDFVKRGVVNSPRYTFRRSWTDGFPTVTKKFEFYSETIKKALTAHAEKHKVSVDKVLEVTGYDARGEKAFIPHYEAPRRHGDRKDYPFDLVDYKSRLNQEGRSANVSWYYIFKKCDPGDVSFEDVIQINPSDAAKLGIKDGDLVKVSTVLGSAIIKVSLWEGVRPGTVVKCYGQGHWSYGRNAVKDPKKYEPRGVNFNELMPDDYDYLSGSTARNGGFVGVKIEKI